MTDAPEPPADTQEFKIDPSIIDQLRGELQADIQTMRDDHKKETEGLQARIAELEAQNRSLQAAALRNAVVSPAEPSAPEPTEEEKYKALVDERVKQTQTIMKELR